MSAALMKLLDWLAPSLARLAIGFALGFAVAFALQGLRLTHLQQEFTQYRQDQAALIQAASDKANHQREKASQDYAELSERLTDEINRHLVYRRCVAAGKCGLRHLAEPADSGACLSSASGSDAPGPNAIPTLAGYAAEGANDPVVDDCAVTTLQLNRLQSDIQNQPGYGGH